MGGDDLRLGTVLGDRYRVDELIGRGGTSTVYLGFDTQLRRRVAIKIFQPGDDGDELRWQSEIHLLSQLSHPSLVTLHDAHLEPRGARDASYLVMEYVPGGTLQQHLADHGPSGPLAALVLSQIGEGLAAVHSRDVIHRDLKPGNILIEPSDLPPLHVRAKLADFGIAHLLGSDRLTRTGTTIGTAAYLSPEQLNGDAPTTASDIYSLGLVALECITGRPSFPGTASESLIARLTRDPGVPVGLPDRWTALLTEMTAREPSHRPAAIDVAVRARELAPLLADLPIAPGPESAVSSLVTQQMLRPTLVLPNPTTAGAATAAPTAAPTAATAVVTGLNPPVSTFPSSPRRIRPRVIIALVAVTAVLVVALAALIQLPSGDAAQPPPSSPLDSPTASVISSTPASTPTTPTTPIPVSTPGPGNGNGHGKKNRG